MTARGSWGPVVVGFFVYLLLLLAGFALDAPALNLAGAIAMLVIAMAGNHRRMLAVRPAPVSRWAVAFVLALVATFAASPSTEGIAPTLKYVLVFVAFIQIFSWRLTPVQRAPVRSLLLAGCVGLIAFSFLSGAHFASDEEQRLSGIFANPNNLALVALGLLTLVGERDSRSRKLVVHVVVVATLVVTATLGAIVAYAAMLAYEFRERLATWKGAVAALLIVGVAAVIGGGAAGERLERQVEVIRGNLQMAVEGDVEYGQLAAIYGDSATSGIWRLEMWSRVVTEYARGRAVTLWIGNGVGTSREKFGNLPHNEFLRLLFETGAVGLCAFLGFFAAAWRALGPSQRHVLVGFLLYCCTENNLDNFLFMTLLMLYLGSTIESGKRGARASEMRPAPGIPAWSAPS